MLQFPFDRGEKKAQKGKVNLAPIPIAQKWRNGNTVK